MVWERDTSTQNCLGCMMSFTFECLAQWIGEKMAVGTTRQFLADGFTREFRTAAFDKMFNAAYSSQVHSSRYSRIYHYTDARGLLGTIEGNCLWSTSGHYQNDSREIFHGQGVFASISRELAEAVSNPYQKSLLTTLAERMEHEKIVTPYLTCFARQPDQLSQWRGYGARGSGYSIGFDVMNFCSRLNGIGYPLDVVYVAADQKGIAKAVLTAYWDYVVAKEERWIRSYQKELEAYLYSVASVFAASFKDEGFSEEGEFRYVVLNQEDRMENLSFRERNGLVIPYQRLQMVKETKLVQPGLRVQPNEAHRQPEHLLPIDIITVGPCLDASLAIASIKMLLKQSGYDVQAIRIEPSKIPFLP